MTDTRKNIGILQANLMDAGVCEFCAGIHINFYDGAGEVFATGLLPAHHLDDFIARLRTCAGEIAVRHAAPSRKQ